MFVDGVNSKARPCCELVVFNSLNPCDFSGAEAATMQIVD
jgi:hypothetical protein